MLLNSWHCVNLIRWRKMLKRLLLGRVAHLFITNYPKNYFQCPQAFKQFVVLFEFFHLHSCVYLFVHLLRIRYSGELCHHTKMHQCPTNAHLISNASTQCPFVNTKHMKMCFELLHIEWNWYRNRVQLHGLQTVKKWLIKRTSTKSTSGSTAQLEARTRTMKLTFWRHTCI